MSKVISQVASSPALLSLTKVAHAISSRQISSREATQACIDRIQAWQPRINAFLAIDAEPALRAADAADNASTRRSDLPVLHGVPLAHKDMFYDEGYITTCGSLIQKDWRAPSTSTVLARLRQAGAIRLGTLNMAEFAYGPTGHNEHYGAVCNPWRVDRITGGSSSGSGAAVAACLTFAALGSDTGGSVRLPASFCGVTGLKTTAGRVSRANAMPLSQTLDTVGPLARTTEDCALLLQLIAGSDPLDPTTSNDEVPRLVEATRQSIRGCRVGIPRDSFFEDLDPEIERAMDDTVNLLKGEGVVFVEVKLPNQTPLNAAAQIILAVEAAALHKRWMLTRPQDYGAQVRARLENGLVYTGTQYCNALRWRGIALTEHLAAAGNVDALLLPVTRRAAPTLAESDLRGSHEAEIIIQAITCFLRPINYLGLPALVFPAGTTKTGMPIGMQLVGRPFGEAILLRLGAGFQRVTDFHTRIPDFPQTA